MINTRRGGGYLLILLLLSGTRRRVRAQSEVWCSGGCWHPLSSLLHTFPVPPFQRPQGTAPLLAQSYEFRPRPFPFQPSLDCGYLLGVLGPFGAPILQYIVGCLAWQSWGFFLSPGAEIYFIIICGVGDNLIHMIAFSCSVSLARSESFGLF